MLKLNNNVTLTLTDDDENRVSLEFTHEDGPGVSCMFRARGLDRTYLNHPIELDARAPGRMLSAVTDVRTRWSGDRGELHSALLELIHKGVAIVTPKVAVATDGAQSVILLGSATKLTDAHKQFQVRSRPCHGGTTHTFYYVRAVLVPLGLIDALDEGYRIMLDGECVLNSVECPIDGLDGLDGLEGLEGTRWDAHGMTPPAPYRSSPAA